MSDACVCSTLCICAPFPRLSRSQMRFLCLVPLVNAEGPMRSTLHFPISERTLHTRHEEALWRDDRLDFRLAKLLGDFLCCRAGHPTRLAETGIEASDLQAVQRFTG